jgi:LmbE family N-acetylglucosaminyl deacetylase
MRVLAVGAHPDDIEILCAGTLLKYRSKGYDVVMAIATNGEQGHISIMPEELAAIRREEAEASAAILGAELIWMNNHDQFMMHDQATRLAFVEMVRHAAPDVVITHDPQDYSLDHRIVAELVFAATFMASVPHIETGSKPTTRVPPLYYMDSIGGSNFLPTEYVDVSDFMERKLRMLECHQSQLSWLKEHVNVDILGLTHTVAKFRGLACGVTYAEGFKHLDAWGRTPVGNVLP